MNEPPVNLDRLTAQLGDLEEYYRPQAVTSHQRNLVGQLSYLRRFLPAFSPDTPPSVRQRNRYGPDWERLRIQVLARDGCRCTECGETWLNYLEIHHIQPLGAGGTNELDNLVTLCRLCHLKAHGHPLPAG